jgi:AraC family transcriptional regulator, transcriptional activator of the genes for pyochelin and ferripyochelin receptors
MAVPDVHIFLKNLAGNLSGTWRREGNGSILTFSNNSGSGKIRGIGVEKGIAAMINEFVLERPLSFYSFSTARYFRLSFYLEGEFEQKNYSSGIRNKINRGICRVSVFNVPGRNRIENINGRIKSLDLVLNQPLLRSALLVMKDCLVRDRLQRMLSGNGNDSFVTRPSAGIMRKVEGIVNSIDAGQLCNVLKFRALVLELLSDLVATACDLERIDVSEDYMTAADRVKLFQAKEYLDKNIINTPTLRELSKIVGLNEFKLKRGFKSVFKTTIHSYCVDLKLCQSCNLLKNSDCLVSEVCYGVGYQCPSKFISLFRKKFGCTPGQFRKGNFCNY